MIFSCQGVFSEETTHVWLTHCRGATEGADGQVAFMRQLHESSFRVAQSSGSESLRTAFQPFLTEWIHGHCAGHYETACVTGSTYYQHLSPFVYTHHWLYVDIPELIPLNLRVPGLIVEDKCHTPSHPSPTVTSRWGLWSSTGIYDFFALLMNMQDVAYLSSSLPNPPFLNSGWPPSLFFMMCSQGERPATPLSWVALNEEKKRGRKILPGPFPNEQINASVLQEMREGEKDREAIGTTRPRPKHSHRSSYHMLWMGPFLT